MLLNRRVNIIVIIINFQPIFYLIKKEWLEINKKKKKTVA